MTLTVTEQPSSVKITHTDADGEESNIIIVGLSKSEAENKKEEYAKAHNLI